MPGKSRKRPRSWHRSKSSSRIFDRLQRSLPKSDAQPESWGEPVQLNRKTQRPKKRDAS